MKDLLQKLADLENTLDSMDATPKEIKQINEAASMSINMSGETADDVARLVQIMQKGGAPDAGEMKPDMMPPMGPPDMGKMRDLVKDLPPMDMDGPVGPGDDMNDLKPGIQKEPCDACGKVHLGNSSCGSHEDVDAEIDAEVDEAGYDNSPEEEYKDHNYMTKDLSGGINREKKAYAAAQDGDNAMAVEELQAALRDALMTKMAEGGDEEGEHDHEDGEDCPECGAPGKKKLMACASCGCS